MAENKKFTEEDDALLAELGIEVEAKKAHQYNTKEQRIIAGFEEILNFVEKHGRMPEHGENNDIFERLYAVRLDKIRSSDECVELLKIFDTKNLLNQGEKIKDISNDIDDEELLKQLGVDIDADESITKLIHVKTRAEKKAAEEIANRTRCEDFEKFKNLFEQLKKEVII